MRRRDGRLCVGLCVAGILQALLQSLKQIDAFLALELQLAQRVDEGSLGGGGRTREGGGAVGVVVGDVVERGSPGAQGLGLVALRLEVDGGGAGEKGLVVGLLCGVGAHCTRSGGGGVVKARGVVWGWAGV